MKSFYLLAASQRISFQSLIKNCNHKCLGIYYLLSAFIFGISGTLISVLIRIELYSSGNRIISPENQNFYNISITLHGFLMIFFLVMPGLFGGFGNYFVPIFQGSPEVVYPRVNDFSFFGKFSSALKAWGSGALKALGRVQRLRAFSRNSMSHDLLSGRTESKSHDVI